MDEAEIVGLAQQAIGMTLQLGMPVMLIGLLVGVIIALFQALTQIQEMTLAFVPKILAIFAAIYLLMPMFAVLMTEYMQFLADTIIAGNPGGG
jgi:flagellar biosynthetic protein FliQ